MQAPEKLGRNESFLFPIQVMRARTKNWVGQIRVDLAWAIAQN